MEYLKIAGLPLEASCIALGTWAIGGWMWGGTEESDAISTIHAALGSIHLIDKHRGPRHWATKRTLTALGAPTRTQMSGSGT